MRLSDTATSSHVELPSFVSAATAASRRAESRATRIAIYRTVLLIGAAVFGAVTITKTLGTRSVDWSGWAVLLIFVALLGLRFFEWNEDKRDSPRLISSAVAELSASHAWRYAVKAKPYTEASNTETETEVKARFLNALQDYHKSLAEVVSALPGGRQVTPWMEDLRTSELSKRIDAYLTLRIKPLVDRADREGRRSGRMHSLLFRTVLIIELVGIPLGALKAQNLTAIDWIGVLSAAAAGLALLANSTRLSQRSKAARLKAQVLNYVADQTLDVRTEIDWAALVTKVEDHITLDAEAALASGAKVNVNSSAVSRYTMTPEDYFNAVDHLRQRIWGGLGGPVHAPDVLIALNPGGAIVGGILYFAQSRTKFVPLTLRAGLKAEVTRTYLRNVEFSAQKSDHLVVLIIDASLKSGRGMAEAVEHVKAVLEEKGWGPANSPGEHGVYTLKTAVITQPTRRPEESPRLIEADYVHDTTTQRFPYGTV